MAIGFGYKRNTIALNLSRPILGTIKTVTIKEDRLGDFYMSVVTDHTVSEVTPKTGQAAGFDFGIKTLFTLFRRNTLRVS